jgi:hypothetical protein
MTSKSNDNPDALGTLQARYWRLISGLTGLCAEIEKAGVNERKALLSTAKTICAIMSNVLSVAFCRKDGVYFSEVTHQFKIRLQIKRAELKEFWLRHPSIPGTPSTKILPVSLGDFHCFQSQRRRIGDGLIAFLGNEKEPRGLLFLWPKKILLQEDEDIFTVAASCLSSACSVAAQKEAEALKDLAEREMAAWRDMATKIAHLTTTPLLLAECELSDAREERNGQSIKSLKNASTHIQEARRALDRAFLFEHAGETLVRDRLDFRRTLKSAFSTIGETPPNLGKMVLPVFGNDFRLWFAMRDLLVCARNMCKKKGCVEYAIQNTEAEFKFQIIIPVIVSKIFSADCLFSPQHYVAGRESCAGKWPLSISLFLSKQLVSELRGGALEASMSKDRSQLILVFRCAFQVSN